MTPSTEFKEIKRGIARIKKKIESIKKKETIARAAWAREYQRYRKAAAELAQLKRHGTIKEKGLRKIVLAWDERTVELTKNRDQKRDELERARQELTQLQITEANLAGRIDSEREDEDQIVETVFKMTASMKAAESSREIFVTDNIYPRLEVDGARIKSRVILYNAGQTRRVVARTNYLQFVEPEYAIEAIGLIKDFFDKLMPKAELNDETQLLYNIAKAVIVTSISPTSLKIGPEFHHFLRLRIAKTKFPDFWRAQDLLKQSIRSRQTSKYIRLFEKDKSGKFQPFQPQG